MLEHLLRTGPLTRVPFQNWQEKVSQHVSFLLLEPVLLHQQPIQGKMSESSDVFENVFVRQGVFFKELFEALATQGVVLGHWANHFYHLSKVIICFTVVLTFTGVK